MARISVVAGSLLSAACVLTVAASAQTPTSQPASVGQTPPTSSQPAPPSDSATRDPLFRVDDLVLDLMFEGAYDQRKTRFDFTSITRPSYRQVNRNRRFEESVGLHATGAVIDDRWMQFDIAGRWGLSQEWFTEARPGPDLREDPHGDLLEYDVGLTLLPHGKLSATAYAQRLDSRVPRAFQPSLDRTRERFGGELLYSDTRLPMRFSFEHIWDELTSRTGNLQDDEQRGRNTFDYEATWQINDHHSLQLQYEYDDRREQYSGSNTRFDTTRNYVTLNHILRFGPNCRSSWETLARFQDETGDLARDNVEVSTRLRLQHTDALARQLRRPVPARFVPGAINAHLARRGRPHSSAGRLSHDVGTALWTATERRRRQRLHGMGRPGQRRLQPREQAGTLLGQRVVQPRRHRYAGRQPPRDRHLRVGHVPRPVADVPGPHGH